MDKQKVTILVVDDYYIDLFLIERVLLDLGFEKKQIIKAETGKEALKLFDLEKPNIVFLDLTLPNYSGLDILKMIKEKSPETIVIIVTNNDDENIVKQAIDNQANAYLLKSFTLDEMREKFKIIFDVFVNQKVMFIKYNPFKSN